MSSISGIGNSTLNPLDPYSLQQTNGQGTTQTSATDTTTTDSTEGTEASSGHHHHHGGDGGGISSQIESAVTSALQNAPDGADPNQTIQDAIAAVSKQESGQATTDPSQTTADGADTGTGSTSAGDFNALLQQHGIDPKQFQQDFQTAVKNIQSDGTVDFGSLFKSFPPGAAVDTTA